MCLNRYETSDLWLLLSVILSGNGSTLRNIISVGDLMNHAIFTVDEINCGLSKLELNGYLEIRDKKFYPTSKAKDFYKGNSRLKEGMISNYLRLSDLFCKIRVDVKPALVNEYFTTKEVDDAYNEYINPPYGLLKRLVDKFRRILKLK